jgi:hypothetical protein
MGETNYTVNDSFIAAGPAQQNQAAQALSLLLLESLMGCRVSGVHNGFIISYLQQFCSTNPASGMTIADCSFRSQGKCLSSEIG